MVTIRFEYGRGSRRVHGNFENDFMAQRAIQTGPNPTVIIRAGAHVRVTGADSNQVLALGVNTWGFKLAQRGETIEARSSAGADVMVPFGSSVTVYSGAHAEVIDVRGVIAVSAGANATVRNGGTLAHISAGGRVDFDVNDVEGLDVKFSAGAHLRCSIRNLTDARLMVNDAHGYWEGVIGHGRVRLRLKAGGRVTVVTDQDILAQPPHYTIGDIEPPPDDEKPRHSEYL
jgi:hypothetical protein